jgi:orotate phosphoribosyltransferase
MENWQKEFIQFIFSNEALRFGEFQTKSHRLSPYFFNAGGLNTGAATLELGKYYAKAITHFMGKELDIIYGPAYKGIPLSVMASMQLKAVENTDSAYCFNRKESKDHGEKGLLVGKQPTKGSNIIIIDDVITAGTSIRETLELLKPYDGINIQGVIVALDRQEKGIEKPISALQEIKDDFGIDVYSIVTMQQIIEMLENGELPQVDSAMIGKMKEYRDQYGV